MARMTMLCTAAAMLLSLAAAIAPAQARPPTVTNSPGYEARLAESRKAREAAHAPAATTTRHPRKPKPAKPE